MTDQPPPIRPVPGQPITADFAFDLLVPQDGRRRLALAWLGLGLFALLASGLFSVLLVLSRTPQLQTLFPVADFFRVALVVHVDLSVLVWFLAFGGGLWTLSGTHRYPGMAWLAFALSAAGTLVMCIAPFVQVATPVMANYVPVLDGPVFLAGLVLFGAGITMLLGPVPCVLASVRPWLPTRLPCWRLSGPGWPYPVNWTRAFITNWFFGAVAMCCSLPTHC